jgi:hypothetical protein
VQQEFDVHSPLDFPEAGITPSCRILRQHIDDSPDLGDSAVDEAENEGLVVGDGFTGWWDARVFAAVGQQLDALRVALAKNYDRLDDVLDRMKPKRRKAKR